MEITNNIQKAGDEPMFSLLEFGEKEALGRQCDPFGLDFAAKKTENRQKIYDADSATKKRTLESSNNDSQELRVSKEQKIEKAIERKANKDQWDAMFLRLVAYKKEKGDCLVPKRYAPDPKLGTWVETQRVQYKRLQREWDANSGTEEIQPNKRLDQSRLAKLNSIGFAWTAKVPRKATPEPQDPLAAAQPPVAKPKPKKPPPDDTKVAARSLARSRAQDAQWNELYDRLVKYKEEFGNTLVPRKYDKDPRLASWVETQRMLWNRDFRGTDGCTNSENSKDVAPDDNDADTCADPTDITKDPSGIKRLTQVRKNKLDALGFVWSLRTKRIDDHWDDMYRQLVDYKEKHGDCLVPSRYDENLKLGKWVETQRYEYTKLLRASTDVAAIYDDSKRNANHRLTAERLQRLQNIGFEWKVRNKMKRYYDKQWDQMFDRLMVFKAKHGHCMVPKRYPEDLKLGTWVHTQRIQYRKIVEVGKNPPSDVQPAECVAQLPYDAAKAEEDANHRLTDDRRKRLTDAGFVWSVREGERPVEQNRIVRTSYDDQWDAMFGQLKLYKEKYGDCLVPKRFAENPKLGTWVDTQRVQYKKIRKKQEDGGGEESIVVGGTTKPAVGRLTEERIRRLEDLGFVWSLRDDWQKHYNELARFKEENGHCNVPARYAKNRRLGIWVSAQRQQYKSLQKLEGAEKRNVRLTQERINLLNKLGFTWILRTRDGPGESWCQKVRELKNFKDSYGHCEVPLPFPKNPELGAWVRNQRILYHNYMTRVPRNNGDGYTEYFSEEKIRILDELGFRWALDFTGYGSGSGDGNLLQPGSTEVEGLQAERIFASGYGSESGDGSLRQLGSTGVETLQAARTLASAMHQNYSEEQPEPVVAYQQSEV